MFEDYYFGDTGMREILEESGYYDPAAEPIVGIGSPVVAAPVAAPSMIETAAVAPAAGGPLAQEQYDAMADRRAAANARPQGTYIAAPTGGRGESTGFETPGQESNTFQYRGGPVRVVDGKGKVLFSGEGPEGALAAARFAQNLSDTKGPNATWDLQEGERTINPDGSVGPIRYVSGPSTRAKGMGTLGDLAAFVLPIAVAIATGGMSLPAQMALSAAAGGVGGVLSGNDPLKAALISGAAAGLIGKTGLDKALGGALGDVGGKLAGKTAEEATKQATGEIVVTGLSKALQGAGSALGQTALTQAGKAGLGEITGYKTPAEKFVEPTPVDDTIIVTGNKGISKAADAVTGAVTGAIPTKITPTTVEPQPVEKPKEEIVVTGSKTATTSPNVGAGIGGVIPGIEKLINSTELEDVIDKEKARTEDKKSTLEKAKDLAGLVNAGTALLPLVAGGGGDSITIAPDTSKITFRRSTLRPTIPVGGIGGTGGYPYTPQTYGRRGGDQETEYLFFTREPEVVTGKRSLDDEVADKDYVPPESVTGKKRSPDTIMIADRGLVPPADKGMDWSAPDERLVPPADEGMDWSAARIIGKKEGGEIEDDMVKHLVEYHKNGGHQGPGQVKGIGSGQDDKIPAWLSDGEYVWSAQDVADLGDGSTDEGVRRLDKMRQMVRRQAGRKDVKKIAKPQKGIDTMLKAVGGLA